MQIWPKVKYGGISTDNLDLVICCLSLWWDLPQQISVFGFEGASFWSALIFFVYLCRYKRLKKMDFFTENPQKLYNEENVIRGKVC